jgi:hypothetical protein
VLLCVCRCQFQEWSLTIWIDVCIIWYEHSVCDVPFSSYFISVKSVKTLKLETSTNKNDSIPQRSNKIPDDVIPNPLKLFITVILCKLCSSLTSVQLYYVYVSTGCTSSCTPVPNYIQSTVWLVRIRLATTVDTSSRVVSQLHCIIGARPQTVGHGLHKTGY